MFGGRRSIVTFFAICLVLLIPGRVSASGSSDCFIWYYAQTDITGVIRCAAVDGRLIVGTQNNVLAYSGAISHKDVYCVNSDPLPPNYISGGAYAIYHNNMSTICFWNPASYNPTTRDNWSWWGNYQPACGSGTYRVLAQAEVARNFAWQFGACQTAWVSQ